MSASTAASNVERVRHPRERLAHDRDALGARGHRQAHVGGRRVMRRRRSRSSRAASIAASRPLTTGRTGTRPVMSRIRCTPGSTDSPTQTTKPWPASSARRRASSSAPSTEESTNVAPREVDDDAAAAADRLVEALAQGRGGVDVVLAFDDDDDDVPGGVVEHDRIGVHVGPNDTRRRGRR